jgi:hypothetical protein
VGSDFAVHPPVYPPFDARAIGFAGDRAFAHDGNDGWESADGGEKWTKVPSGSAGDVRCSEAGCLQGDAVRVGWDLPNAAKELVASSAEAPKKKGGGDDASTPPTAEKQSPQKMVCTMSGAWKPFDAEARQLKTALDGDVRFLTPMQSKDGATSLLVARGNGAPTKVALLGPWPKRKPEDNTRERAWTERSSEGYVSIRYAFSKGKSADGKYAPVDVDLAWYSAATGKATKVSLPKVAPFRVGQAGPSALHAIVEGGLLFLPNGGDAPLTFVRDGGKTESMPRPPQADKGHLPHLGMIPEDGLTGNAQKGFAFHPHPVGEAAAKP